MTKEELEKEAEEFTDSKKSFWRQGRTCIDSVKQAYLASAEPREKRIAELEDKLANADYQLEGRDLEIKELKEQIEKMKSCANCKHQCSFLFQDEIDCADNGLPKWEIKEND